MPRSASGTDLDRAILAVERRDLRLVVRFAGAASVEPAAREMVRGPNAGNVSQPSAQSIARQVLLCLEQPALDPCAVFDTAGQAFVEGNDLSQALFRGPARYRAFYAFAFVAPRRDCAIPRADSARASRKHSIRRSPPAPHPRFREPPAENEHARRARSTNGETSPAAARTRRASRRPRLDRRPGYDANTD